MRVIRLTHGAGNGVDKACLLTASNMLIGRGQDGDNNHCVCPVIARFIIRTNDSMPEKLLGELYGPLLWEILGTRSDDPEVERKRGYCFADWAVRVAAPIRLEARGQHSDAATLRALPEIVDRETAEQARKAADADADAYAAAYAAADAAADAKIWHLCPEIIRKAASIGDKRPVECVITREQLCEALN